ncbi:hypothetical protein Mapa_015119 [Marchantia paleacea]|nr:hypothetical protein Mapa_015119 [Marchantia paleacea]
MGVPKFSMAFDTEDILSVISVVGEHTMKFLADGEERVQHKARSAERLRKGDVSGGARVNYADQAILANLDWGIEAIEEAIRTAHPAAKSARLEYAEKLLQVCASLDCRSGSATAGVPNSYLSAWAHFNLALVWRLRGNELRAVKEILEMFLLEPYFARLDFAASIWESAFLPHVSSIVQWYTDQRRALAASPSASSASAAGADAASLSLSAEESHLQELEKVYQDSLDENTRQYARFYLECLNHDSASSRRGLPLMPIAETPMSPTDKSHRDRDRDRRRPRGVRLPPPLGIDLSQQQQLALGSSSSATSELDDGPGLAGGGPQDTEDRLLRSEHIAATSNETAALAAEAEAIGRQSGPQSKRMITRSTSRRRKLQAENWSAAEDAHQKLTMTVSSAMKVDVQVTNAAPTPLSLVPPEIQRSSSGDYQFMFSENVNRELSYSDSSRSLLACAPAPSGPNQQHSSDDEADYERELTQAQKREAATVIRNMRIERSDSRASSTFSQDGEEIVRDARYLEEEEEQQQQQHENEDDDENWPSSTAGFFEDSPESPVQSGYSHGQSSVHSQSGLEVATTTAKAVSLFAEADLIQTRRSVAGSNKSHTPPLVVRAPKDFVCPITSQLFNDPVTLETGQTYERKAIQNWLDCGNTTCPVTRQTLRFKRLPKTNFVMKRLVESWKDQNLPRTTQDSNSVQSLSTVFQFEFGSPSPETSKLTRLSSEISCGSPEICSPRSDSSVSSLDSECSRKSPPRHDTSLPVDSTGTRNSPSLSLRNQDRPENLDIVLEDLQSALAFLCSSDDLHGCESAILLIARMWRDSEADPEIATTLSREKVVGSLIEVLSSSKSTKVHMASLYLMSGTLAALERTRSMILRADPDVQCLVELVKKGVSNAVVVLYQLKLPTNQLTTLDLLVPLIAIIKHIGDESRKVVEGEDPMPMRPKTAAVLILDQIVTCNDQSTIQRSSQIIIDLAAVPALTTSLDSDCMDERTAAVSLLLCCMQSVGRCRTMIARSAHLAPVVQLLHCGDPQVVTRTISFLAEIVRITRTQINDILQVVRSEGLLSSMHMLLMQLQMAPLQQRPVAAGLLLQLDLMSEPLKRSIYRDEVVETLVEALTRGNTSAQIEAANTIVNLGGRFSSCGKSLTEAWLLKTAGLEKSFATLIKEDPVFTENFDICQMEEEEESALDWEKRVAGALVEDEGSIVPAVAKGLESRLQEIFKPCLIAATWLTCISPSLHDTGVRNKVRIYLLKPFIKVLETSKDTKVKVLATLALHTLVSNPEGAKELAHSGTHLESVLKQLKKSTWAAQDILGTFFHYPSTISGDLYSYGDEGELDASENGEVRAFAQCKNQLFSGHSDGTVKVWSAQKTFPVLIQEAREHTRSVTCLATSSSMDRLYSGSMDKTIRVWALGLDKIKCLHIFELRDAVQGLAVNGPMACIIPQGPGFQVQCEDSATKFLNTNKHVQSLTISDGKVICGCTDNSIQVRKKKMHHKPYRDFIPEFDPIKGSMVTIQSGVKTLLGKKPIYAIQVYKNFLYAAGSPVDGVACKVWNRSSFSLVGHVLTLADVRSMALNANYIFLGSTSGSIEVWKQRKFQKMTTISVDSKVNCLLVDDDVVHSGAEDGKIRVWNCGHGR